MSVLPLVKSRGKPFYHNDIYCKALMPAVTLNTSPIHKWNTGPRLRVEEGLSDVAVVVEVEEDGGTTGVALKRVQLPIAVILHEVEAQLPARIGLRAEVLDPVPYLPKHPHMETRSCAV